jgi:hypothetical protein
MDQTRDGIIDELCRLEHKLRHGDGSPEALRRMSARATTIRMELARRLVITNGVPDATDLAWY